MKPSSQRLALKRRDPAADEQDDPQIARRVEAEIEGVGEGRERRVAAVPEVVDHVADRRRQQREAERQPGRTAPRGPGPRGRGSPPPPRLRGPRRASGRRNGRRPSRARRGRGRRAGRGRRPAQSARCGERGVPGAPGAGRGAMTRRRSLLCVSAFACLDLRRCAAATIRVRRGERTRRTARRRLHPRARGAARRDDARRSRRGRDQGRVARRRRHPPVAAAGRRSGAGVLPPRREPQQALDRARPQGCGRRRDSRGSCATGRTSSSRTSSPGTLERFELDYERVAAGNPGVVYCEISGFGEGAGRNLPGYDPLVQAVGGLMSITGPPGHAVEGGRRDRRRRHGALRNRRRARRAVRATRRWDAASA